MSSKNTNKLNVPEARAAMNKFKMEAASEVVYPVPIKTITQTNRDPLLTITRNGWTSLLCIDVQPFLVVQESHLYMCDMVKPSFIPPPDIRQLRDLMRYRTLPSARNGSFSQRLLVLISLFWTLPSSTPPNIRTCLAASSPMSSSLCSLLEHSSRSIPSLRHRQRALPLHT